MLSATLKDQRVWLRSGDFACEIDSYFPVTGGNFNILGLYTGDIKQFGGHFAVYTFKLLQANLVSEIYPHGNKTGSNGCCVWRDLEYGVREDEAYARATTDLRNPLSLEGIPTGIYGEITVEYILKENSTEIIRHDTIKTKHPLYHLELQQFCQIPNHLKTEGLLHHALSDGTDAAAWQSSGKITVTSNDDAFIGNEALRLTISSGSQGQTVFKALPKVNAAEDKYLCLAMKPKKETHLGEALQFFIENDGVRYPIGHKLSLYQPWILHEDKHKHYQRGEWRQVFFDISAIPRDKLTAIGFEIASNAEIHVNIDDIWIYQRSELPFTGESNTGYAVTHQFPAKAYESKSTNLLNHTIQPYFVHYTRDGYALSIQFPFQNAERVVHYAKNDPTLKVYAATKYNPMPNNTELTAWSAESVFVVRKTWEDMQVFSKEYQQPRFKPGKPSSNLSLRKLLQMRPGNAYDAAAFLSDFVQWGDKTELDADSAPCGLVIGGGSGTSSDYKMPDSVLFNTQWKNVVLDTRQDHYLLAEKIIKGAGKPLCAESFCAVTEGTSEIPFYDRRHLAKDSSGKEALRMVWVYESADGETVTQRTRYDDLTRAECYQPQIKNGKAYTLAYTYPSCRTNLVTQFLSKADTGFDTLGDYRLKRIEYVLSHYDIDAIVLSEDCTNYEYGWTALELAHYNQWRLQKGLKALKEFNRLNNSKVAGSSNPYRCDDAELWAWKNELTKNYIKKVSQLCHQYGSRCIVDVNIETTLPIQDKNNPLYKPDYLKQDNQGNWHTRDFDLLGARFGTKFTDMLEVADFLYVWLYGNYSPWGAVEACRLFLDWVKDKPWKEKLLLAPGYYPSHARPTAEDIRTQLMALIQQGFGAVIPGLPHFGASGIDLTKAVLEPYQLIGKTFQLVTDGSIKPVQFDVGKPHGEGMVARILEDLMLQSQLKPEDYDTSGCHANLYGITLDGTLAATDIIKLLNQVAFFDTIQSAGKLQFQQRKAKAPIAIPAADTQVHYHSEALPDNPQAQQNTRNLPKTLQVTYQSIEDDYWSSTQLSSKVIAKGAGKVNINLPIALSAHQAQTIADILHYQAIIEQDEVSLTVGTKYFHLLPGDCITTSDVNGQPLLLRIEAITSHGPYLHQLRCVKTRQQLYERTRKGIERPYIAPTLVQPAQTRWQLLNLPKLDNGAQDTPQAYFICYSDTTEVKRWPGANLFRETESGLELITQQTLPATVGKVQDSLGPANAYFWDRNNTLIITLLSGTLASVTENEVQSGKNTALIGNEIIQFVQAELIAKDTYRLSQLLRGRLGTERYIEQHQAGEQFVLLESGKLKAIPFNHNARGQAQLYKAVTFNQEPEEVQAAPFVYAGEDLKPLSPVHLKTKIVSGIVTLTWVRQSRLGGTWLDQVDTPLAEKWERYEIEVLQEERLIDTLQTIETKAQYPYQSGLIFKVYQLSETVGCGHLGEISL